MRLWIVVASVAALSSCGGDADSVSRTRGAGEVTVTVPPIQPEPGGEDAPQAGFETVAAATPVEAPSPLAAPTRPAPVREVAAAAEPDEVEVTVAPATEPAATETTGAAGETSPAPVTEVPAERTRPAGATAWAGYLREAGFPCRRVTAAERVVRAANPGLTYYRVSCEGGGPYQATDRRGHLYFRRWRG